MDEKKLNGNAQPITRQWNDDAGNDLCARIVAQINNNISDEAEAIESYNELKETGNPYLTDSDIKIIDAIIANEKSHIEHLMQMGRRIDGIEAKSDVDELAEWYANLTPEERKDPKVQAKIK